MPSKKPKDDNFVIEIKRPGIFLVFSSSTNSMFLRRKKLSFYIKCNGKRLVSKFRTVLG